MRCVHFIICFIVAQLVSEVPIFFPNHWQNINCCSSGGKYRIAGKYQENPRVLHYVITSNFPFLLISQTTFKLFNQSTHLFVPRSKPQDRTKRFNPSLMSTPHRWRRTVISITSLPPKCTLTYTILSRPNVPSITSKGFQSLSYPTPMPLLRRRPRTQLCLTSPLSVGHFVKLRHTKRRSIWKDRRRKEHKRSGRGARFGRGGGLWRHRCPIEQHEDPKAAYVRYRTKQRFIGFFHHQIDKPHPFCAVIILRNPKIFNNVMSAQKGVMLVKK